MNFNGVTAQAVERENNEAALQNVTAVGSALRKTLFYFRYSVASADPMGGPNCPKSLIGSFPDGLRALSRVCLMEIKLLLNRDKSLTLALSFGKGFL